MPRFLKAFDRFQPALVLSYVTNISLKFLIILNTRFLKALSGVTVNNPLAKPTPEAPIDQIEHGLRNVLKASCNFLCVSQKRMKIFIPNESYAFNSVKHFSNGKDTEC